METDPETDEEQDLVSAYDGKDYWHRQRKTIYIGEERSLGAPTLPGDTFWHAARSLGWLRAAMTKWTSTVEPSNDGTDRWLVTATSKSDVQPKWKYEVLIAPKQGWLPVRTKLFQNDKLYATETLSNLRQVTSVWYPELIEFERTGQVMFGAKRSRLEVTKFALRTEFPDDAFQPQVTVAHDVMDYGAGLCWYVDPWWPDLKEWLFTELDWPRNGTLIPSAKSYADAKIEGQSAPLLQPRVWVNRDADFELPSWKSREQGVSTVLCFFGGRAISPTPQWFNSLRQLQAAFPKTQVELVGVVPATSEKEMVARTCETLHLDFPVAIDASDEQGHGKTYNAYGLESYAGFVIVDEEARVRLIAPENEALLRLFSRGSVSIDPDKPVKQVDRRLSIKDYRRIEARWKTLRAKSGSGTIRGRVVALDGARDRFEPNPAGEASGTPATIKAVPTMLLASMNLPGGYTSFADREHAAEVQTEVDGSFELPNLPKGTYELTITSEFGLATTTDTATLATNGSQLELSEFRLHQADYIEGQVLDEKGNHVANAEIRARRRFFDPKHPNRETNSPLPTDTRSDGQGRFRLDDLHVGAYTFEIEASGFETYVLEAVPAGKENVEVRLKRQN